MESSTLNYDHKLNSIMTYFINFVSIMGLLSISHVLILLPKMINSKEKFVPLIILFAPYFVMLLSLPHFGPTP